MEFGNKIHPSKEYLKAIQDLFLILDGLWDSKMKQYLPVFYPKFQTQDEKNKFESNMNTIFQTLTNSIKFMIQKWEWERNFIFENGWNGENS
jgi:hypothetical protein